MDKKIDTVIFDLGGVLVDWNPEYLYQKIFDGDHKKVRWFLNTVCTSQWNLQQDCGRSIREATELKIAEFPQYKTWIQSYYDRWTEMFSGAIEESVAVFEALKRSKQYRIYALTNWSAETWPVALQLFPFLKTFEGVVVSGQEKTRKPFDAIYKIIFERYRITPQNTIFIDDNYENVKAADKFGMTAIHFRTPEKLALELRKSGVDF